MSLASAKAFLYRGDIDYVGQIDGDLADFVAQRAPATRGETPTLVRFFASAGFGVRVAGVDANVMAVRRKSTTRPEVDICA